MDEWILIFREWRLFPVEALNLGVGRTTLSSVRIVNLNGEAETYVIICVLACFLMTVNTTTTTTTNNNNNSDDACGWIISATLQLSNRPEKFSVHLIRSFFI